MSRAHVLGLAVVALFATSGCKFLKKTPPDAGQVTVEDTDAEADAAVAAVVDAGPDAAAVHVAVEAPLPTPADDETKAIAEILAPNYKDELDKVEKDMQTEK